jgi:hypothetical protein
LGLDTDHSCKRIVGGNFLPRDHLVQVDQTSIFIKKGRICALFY